MEEEKKRRAADLAESERRQRREAGLERWKSAEAAMPATFEALVAEATAPGDSLLGACFRDCSAAEADVGGPANEFEEKRCVASRAMCQKAAVGSRFTSFLLVAPARYDEVRRGFPLELPSVLGDPGDRDPFDGDRWPLRSSIVEKVPLGVRGALEPFQFTGTPDRQVFLPLPDEHAAEAVRRSGHVIVHYVFEVTGTWSRRLTSPMERRAKEVLLRAVRQEARLKHVANAYAAQPLGEAYDGFVARVLGIQVRDVDDGRVLHSTPAAAFPVLRDLDDLTPCWPEQSNDLLARYVEALAAAWGQGTALSLDQGIRSGLLLGNHRAAGRPERGRIAKLLGDRPQPRVEGDAHQAMPPAAPVR
jgi:hypothetical protein